MTASRGQHSDGAEGRRSVESGVRGDGTNGPTGSSVRKPCVFCGVECDGQPRVKDPQGRYYCKPCYDSRESRRGAGASQQPRTPAGSPSRESSDQDDPMIDLAALASAASAAPAAASAALTCPACASSLAPGSVFCVGCGHDLRTGAKAATKVLKAPKSAALGGKGGGGSGGRGGGAPRGGTSALSGPLVGWTLGLGGSIPAIIAVITAASDGIERHYTRLALSQELAGAGLRAPPSGGAYLIGTMIGSLIGGLLYYFIASWWFQKRVRWAGGDVDTETARSSYFATLLPYTLFSVIAAILLLTSGGIGASSEIAGTLSVIALGTLFATCIWLFWIAKEAFGVRTVPGVLLLVVLPWAVYGTVIAVVIASAVALATIAETRNDAPLAQAGSASTSARQVLFPGSPNAPIQITHPEGWVLTEMPRDEGEPTWGIFLDRGERGEDTASLGVYASTEPVIFNDWVREITAEFRKAGMTLVPSGSLTTLGPFAGQGTEFSARSADGRGRARLFVAEVPDRGWIMLQIFVPEPDGATSGITIQRMVNSIVVRW